MANLRDMLRRAFGGRNPEDALIDFKEKLHAQINEFKDNPQSRARLQGYLRSILTPLQYFNAFMVRPNLNDNEKMRELARKYQINKVELKRVFKVALELEEKVQAYFSDGDQIDQLVVTLRKVINVLDEQIVTDIIDAMDYNIDLNKIENAYLDYQSKLQQAYNADGLNRDLQGIMGTVMSSLKNAFTQPSTPRTKASDKRPEVRMLEPELQKLYDHFREEGYEHSEAMAMIQEKQDVESLSAELMETYRQLRREGKSHGEAMAQLRAQNESRSTDTHD